MNEGFTYQIVFGDSGFSLSDNYCLSALIIISALIGLLSFLMVRKIKRKQFVGIKSNVSYALIVLVLNLISPQIISGAAGLIATIGENIKGSNMSIGYPFGEAPYWPAIVSTFIAIIFALSTSNKRKISETPNNSSSQPTRSVGLQAVVEPRRTMHFAFL